MYVYAFNILFVPANLWDGRADLDADADDIRIMALPPVVVVPRGSAVQIYSAIGYSLSICTYVPSYNT